MKEIKSKLNPAWKIADKARKSAERILENATLVPAGNGAARLEITTPYFHLSIAFDEDGCIVSRMMD